MSRTIFIAGGYPHHLPEAIVKTFANRGWRTEFFDLSPESPFHRPFVKPVRKLIHNLRIKRHPETFDRTIISNLGWRSHHWLKRLREIKPDAALILRGNRIALPQLQAAAREGFSLFAWMLEPESKMSSFLLEVKARVYRGIFVYAHSYVTELEKLGAPAIYYPHRALEMPDEAAVLNRQRRYQWCFLGAHSPWREKIFREILPRFPNGYLQGPRWPRLKDDALFRDVVHSHYFGQKENMDLYLSSTIGLDVSGSPDSSDSGLAMRIPELLACGCKVLMQPSAEIDVLPYKTGDRLECYRSPEELLAKMEKELAGRQKVSPDEVLSVARNVIGHDDIVNQVELVLVAP